MKLSEARHAFITGGASGIGLGIADALAGCGIAVTIADFDQQTLDRVSAERSGRFQGVTLDVRDRANWAQARAEAEATFGAVNLLFNNAGIAPDGQEYADLETENFDRLIAINLTGVFNGISTFAGAMRSLGRGHIVNTSSMSGMVADGPGLGGYAPSKAAVIAMSEVLRMEMEPYGIGVSVLCPSYVATNLMANTARVSGAPGDPMLSLLDVPTKPSDVAGIVLAAIEDDRPYIFTHADCSKRVEERHARVMACFDVIEQ